MLVDLFLVELGFDVVTHMHSPILPDIRHHRTVIVDERSVLITKVGENVLALELLYLLRTYESLQGELLYYSVEY